MLTSKALPTLWGTLPICHFLWPQGNISNSATLKLDQIHNCNHYNSDGYISQNGFDNLKEHSSVQYHPQSLKFNRGSSGPFRSYY